MASRKDSKGRALRGSQCQMQLYVNVPACRAELDQAVLDSLPTLKAAAAVALEWRSPLWQPLFGDDKPFHEYRDGKMLRAIERSDLRPKLRDHWPARGPTWDAIAVARDRRGKAVGPVLVEAKAYPGEFRDTRGGTAAGGDRRERIKCRLQETRAWLGVPESPELAATWLGELYQSANRFACLRWFRAVLQPEVPAWLLNIYFVDDPTYRSTQRREWDKALGVAVAELGLAGTVPHSGHVFLDGHPRQELVDATGG